MEFVRNTTLVIFSPQMSDTLPSYIELYHAIGNCISSVEVQSSASLSNTMPENMDANRLYFYKQQLFNKLYRKITSKNNYARQDTVTDGVDMMVTDFIYFHQWKLEKYTGETIVNVKAEDVVLLSKEKFKEEFRDFFEGTEVEKIVSGKYKCVLRFPIKLCFNKKYREAHIRFTVKVYDNLSGRVVEESVSTASNQNKRTRQIEKERTNKRLTIAKRVVERVPPEMVLE